MDGLLIGARIAKSVRRNARFLSPSDKVILVTAGAGGLGLVIARELPILRACVAICARNNHELSRVRDEFADSAKHMHTETCDRGVG